MDPEDWDLGKNAKDSFRVNDKGAEIDKRNHQVESPEELTNVIFLSDANGTYRRDLISEILPVDWDCRYVRITEIDDVSQFRIDFLLAPRPPAREERYTLFESFVEDEYDFDSLHAIAAGLNRGYDSPPGLFHCMYVGDPNLSRADLLAKLKELVDFHNAEIARIQELHQGVLLSPNVRSYYKETWGFDPIDEQYPLDQDRVEYCYTSDFPLTLDTELIAAGVQIEPFVAVTREGIHNSIVFKRENKSASVQCVHVVLHSGPWVEALQFADGINNNHLNGMQNDGELIQGPQESLQLPPIEHYVALKSFVGAIAEVGVANLLRSAYALAENNVALRPFGFNAAMPSQFLQALFEVAPEAARDIFSEFIENSAEHTPREWLQSRLVPLLEDFRFRDVICADPTIFFLLEARLDSDFIRALARSMPNTSPEVREYLAGTGGTQAVAVGAWVTGEEVLGWLDSNNGVISVSLERIEDEVRRFETDAEGLVVELDKYWDDLAYYTRETFLAKHAHDILYVRDIECADN